MQRAKFQRRASGWKLKVILHGQRFKQRAHSAHGQGADIQLADMGQHGLLLCLGHGIDAQRHAQKALQLAFQCKMRIAGH